MLVPLLLLAFACLNDEEDSGSIDLPPPCGDTVCLAADGEDPDTCPWDCGFRYAILADLGGGSGGGTPGADVDAVQLRKPRAEYWVETVAYAEIGGPENQWTDPSLIIGPSDSECETQNFVSLGGKRSFVVLSFGSDVLLEVGDEIEVFELSARMCDNGSNDDPWELLVANGTDPSAAEYVGEGRGLGEVEIDPW
ncbi:MAG: hypothetical protein JRI25_07010 [Deltaproteobacteria bacterium]|nr:hypothetical protein [Deltaproteobacteria bacterium]MBW2254333.1 hypothetical protein [Deltaproteobacteria bacterium]